jgi:hypothetical protein
MTWMQKLLAMRSLGSDIGPHLRNDGSWYCSIPGEIGGDGLLKSDHANGKTHIEAIESAWDIIEKLPATRHLRIGGMNGRCVRWNGFMFEIVSRHEYCEPRFSA